MGGTAYPFRAWTLDLSTNKVDVTSFNSSGFSEWLAGFTQGMVRASGFVDPSLQLTPGTSYTLILGIGTSSAGTAYQVTITVVALSVKTSTKVDGAGELEVELGTNGSFTTTYSAA